MIKIFSSISISLIIRYLFSNAVWVVGPLGFAADVNLRYAKALAVVATLLESHALHYLQEVVGPRELDNRVGQVVIGLAVVRHQSANRLHYVVGVELIGLAHNEVAGCGELQYH